MDEKRYLIIAEQNYGSIHHVTYELIGKASELARESGAKICALLLGPEGIPAEEIAYRGADPVYYMADKALEACDEMIYKANIVECIQEIAPELVLVGATSFGRSLAPRIAGALGSGLTADCTDLRLDEEGNVIQIRPAFSDNILAHIRSVIKPQMATIRYKEFNEAVRDEKRPVNIVKLPLKAAADGKTEILESGELGAIDITASDIVVAAGRGIKRAEDMVLVEELADALGGCVAASRALVDAGITSSQIQVGYSGHRVKPKMYVACGISGAPQHLAGMKESGIIVAINSDASAPIFNIADIGYVGDLYEIIPQLTEAIRKNQ